MKNHLIIVCFLTSITFITSCSKEENNPNLTTKDNIIYDEKTNQPYNGTMKGKAGDNFVEYEVVNGKKEGSFLVKDKNDNIIMIGEMKDNLNVGEWKYYYENGQLESKGNFVDNSPSGKWEFFYVNGKLKEVGFFEQGNRVGEWKFYSSSGSLDSIAGFSKKK